MERRQAKRVRRVLTPEEQARITEVRRLVELDKEEILSEGRRHKADFDATHAPLDSALRLLKEERVRQGLSLADVQQRTGIEPPNLSKLENESEANPTITTLSRYAAALGKKLVVVMEDR